MAKPYEVPKLERMTFFTLEEIEDLIAKAEGRRKAHQWLEEQRKPHKPQALSPRQNDVLDLIAQGFTTRRAALALGISHQTVKNHLSAAYARLGARNRTEAIRIAAERGEIYLKVRR